MKVNKRLNITILTTSFPVYEGIAVGIHVLEKAKHLQKLGHKVNIVAPHHIKAKKKEIYEGIPVTRFSYFWPPSQQKLAYGDGIPTNLRKGILPKIQLPFFLLSFFLRARKQSVNSDIIHCHWTIAGLIGVLISKFNSKPVVLSMHGAEIFVLGKNRILNYVLKNTSLLINNSTFTQKEVLKYYPEANCTVIQPGTDTSRFFPKKKEGLRSELNIGSSDVFLLCIGKFIPRKGIEFLIEAMNILVKEKKLDQLKLKIGGRGYLKATYEKKITELELNDNISILPYISDADMPFYHSEADIFVLPSIVDENGDTEGLGVVLVEANACGTPVIGSKVGGIVDVIEDGYNGILTNQKDSADLAESIEKLALNQELRDKLGRNGIQKSNELFNWMSIAEKIEKEYFKILELK